MVRYWEFQLIIFDITECQHMIQAECQVVWKYYPELKLRKLLTLCVGIVYITLYFRKIVSTECQHRILLGYKYGWKSIILIKNQKMFLLLGVIIGYIALYLRKNPALGSIIGYWLDINLGEKVLSWTKNQKRF